MTFWKRESYRDGKRMGFIITRNCTSQRYLKCNFPKFGIPVFTSTHSPSYWSKKPRVPLDTFLSLTSTTRPLSEPRWPRLSGLSLTCLPDCISLSTCPSPAPPPLVCMAVSRLVSLHSLWPTAPQHIPRLGATVCGEGSCGEWRPSNQGYFHGIMSPLSQNKPLWSLNP